jgi:hypothetical protein
LYSELGSVVTQGLFCQLFEMAYKKMAADNQSRESGGSGDSSKKEDQN